MDRCKKPVTSWKPKTTKTSEDNGIEALWNKCIDDNAGTSPARPIVKPPKEDGQYVSIRCRRHKKRFNVPVLWLRTCEWLCPKCYEKLSPAEREKYAPRGTEKPEIRSADPSRPTIRIVVEKPKLEMPRESMPLPKETYAYKQKEEQKPTKLSIAEKAALMASRLPASLTKKEIKSSEIEMDCIYCGTKQIVPKSYYYAEHFFCPSCAKHLYDGERRRFKKSFMGIHTRRYNEIEERFLSLVREERKVQVRQPPQLETNIPVPKPHLSNRTAEGKPTSNTKLVVSSAMSALLPEYRLVCKKCGQTVPCHKTWFEHSVVLCPECYNHMSSIAIDQFHSLNPRSTAKVFKIESKIPHLPSQKATKRNVDTSIESINIDSPARWTAVDSGCTNEFIMHASIKELVEAVKSGKLSKARARIELNRRKNAEYYNELPDADVTVVQM